MAELWPGGPLTLPHTLAHDGVEVTIPDFPVPTLLYWLGTAQWWQLYPNAVQDQVGLSLRTRMFDPDDPFDLIHLHDVATRVWGRLAGMAPPEGTGWWPSVRLANVAITQWPLFNSWCTARGIAPLGESLMTTVSAAYAWMRDGLGPEQLTKFEQTLWETPLRAAAPTAAPEEIPEHIREQEAGAFLAAMGEMLPGQQAVQGIY